jgi:transcription elongation GreA/GreB family factor
LEGKLALAEIVDVSKLSGDTIKFGATVTLITKAFKVRHVEWFEDRPKKRKQV